MTAKLTERHDFLRVTLVDGTAKMNLTMGRSGDTLSGKGIDGTLARKALNALSKFRDKEGQTIGQKMRQLQALGQNSTSIDEFVNELVNLS